MKNQDIIYVTQEELLTVLLNSDIKGNKFTFIVSETTPKMNKTGNPYYGKVVKKSRTPFMTGGQYKDRVNRQRVREGLPPDFEPQKMSGRSRVNDLVCELDSNPQQKYMVVYVNDKSVVPSKSKYFNTETGEEIHVEELRPFFPPISNSSRQGTEKVQKPRTYKVQSIKELSLERVKYIVE